jgi:hypothetical protein
MFHGMRVMFTHWADAEGWSKHENVAVNRRPATQWTMTLMQSVHVITIPCSLANESNTRTARGCARRSVCVYHTRGNQTRTRKSERARSAKHVGKRAREHNGLICDRERQKKTQVHSTHLVHHLLLQPLQLHRKQLHRCDCRFLAHIRHWHTSKVAAAIERASTIVLQEGGCMSISGKHADTSRGLELAQDNSARHEPLRHEASV